MQSKAEQGGKRFLALFREADRDASGYLDRGEFNDLLGLRGLNLKLTLEETDMVLDELCDKNGAIEAKDFTRFLSVRHLSCPALLLNTRA